MARRGSFRGRSAGISDAQRRKKSWFGATSATTQSEDQAANTVVMDLLGVATPEVVTFFFASSDNPALAESTIIRIRGSIELPKNSGLPVSNGNVDVQFAFGICMVTEDAAAVAAVPNPASGIGASWDGWMFYRSQWQGALDANAGVFDVKAMRKWKSGDAFCLVYGASGFNNAPGPSQCFISLRTLFLLP